MLERDCRLVQWLTDRPKEIRGTLYGPGAGFVGGLFIGGVGIVAMGSATGLPACIVLGGLGALVGNRIGVERDKPLPNVFAINRANSHTRPY